jgi:hypothetical protein
MIILNSYPQLEDASKCLIFSKSYELRTEYKDGKKYINIDCSLNVTG